MSDLSYSGLTALVVPYEQSLNFSLQTAGWVATAEGAGYTCGAFLAALSASRFAITRYRVAAILLTLALAQLCSVAMESPWALGACRAFSGVAAGLTYAAGMTSIAARPHAGRGFAIYFGANFASGLVALVVIPPVLASAGLRGFYAAYAALIVSCLVLMRWYPLADDSMTPSSASQILDGTRGVPRSLLASLFINFVFNGGLWVLAEHFGLEIRGTDAQSLGVLLAGTMMFGLVGTLLVTTVGQRLTHLQWIVTGNVGLILAVLVLAQWHTLAGLIIAMAFLNMSVTVLTPASLAALSLRNPQGAQWGNLACQAGYSLGPAVIAMIGTATGFSGLIPISVAAFVLTALLAWLGMSNRLKTYK